MKISFPHMGNLYIPLTLLFSSLGLEVVVPPPISKETMNLGVKYSPEGACLPFKLTLGNFLEAAALGADTFFMAQGYGLCRFGFYTEVQQKIMRELGYETNMALVNISQNVLQNLLRKLKELSGKSQLQVLGAVRLALVAIKVLDDLEKLLYQVRPRELRKGESTKVHQKTVDRLAQASSVSEIRRIGSEGMKELAAVGQDPARTPLRVGILGEFYVVLEPFTSSDVERRLGEMGVEITKYLYASDWVSFHMFMKLFKVFKEHKSAAEAARPYLAYNVSGDGLQTVGQTILCAEEGFDGIVQLYPFTCMPEIVAKHMLPKVSDDFRIPVLSLGLDEHSGNAGFITRLEAFTDLINRRKSLRRLEVAK